MPFIEILPIGRILPQPPPVYRAGMALAAPFLPTKPETSTMAKPRRIARAVADELGLTTPRTAKRRPAPKRKAVSRKPR